MLQLIYIFIKHSRGETKHVPEGTANQDDTECLPPGRVSG